MAIDYASEALAVLAAGRYGALGTLARDPVGAPYVSLVAYALDSARRPLFFLSRLAEHTANILADARASLLVAQDHQLRAAPGSDPLALGRVTLVGRVAPVPDVDQSAARERYLARHPQAQAYAMLPDFAIYRMETDSARYVAGFGRMSWVSGADLATAAPG